MRGFSRAWGCRFVGKGLPGVAVVVRETEEHLSWQLRSMCTCPDMRGALCRDVFKAGASLYGVADIELLAKHTHKFESRYMDLLVGPYPEAIDVYRERSPIHSADKITVPVAILQVGVTQKSSVRSTEGVWVQQCAIDSHRGDRAGCWRCMRASKNVVTA